MHSQLASPMHLAGKSLQLGSITTGSGGSVPEQAAAQY
jgi:hypothetical protein